MKLEITINKDQARLISQALAVFFQTEAYENAIKGIDIATVELALNEFINNKHLSLGGVIKYDLTE